MQIARRVYSCAAFWSVEYVRSVPRMTVDWRPAGETKESCVVVLRSSGVVGGRRGAGGAAHLRRLGSSELPAATQ